MVGRCGGNRRWLEPITLSNLLRLILIALWRAFATSLAHNPASYRTTADVACIIASWLPTAVIRQALLARRFKGHLASIARDHQVSVVALENFATGNASLGPDVLDALAKEMFGANVGRPL